MIALQKQTIALAKKQLSTEVELDEDEQNGSRMPSGAPQAAEPEWAPLPLAMQGPAAVALKLLTDATCTEEQSDAVALLALSMQKRFDARPDKSSILLPVATPTNNHCAVWLGGGGVGKPARSARSCSLWPIPSSGPTVIVQRRNPTMPPRTWAPRVAPTTPPMACS